MLLTIHHWLQSNEGVIVLLSVGARQLLDVIRQQGFVLSPIYLFHLCIRVGAMIRECSYLVYPQFRNRPIFQGTQRVEVKVSGVTRPEEISKLQDKTPT